jgi:hypothetical protein
VADRKQKREELTGMKGIKEMSEIFEVLILPADLKA